MLRRHFRTALPPETKADRSPVTLADREVEQAIMAILQAEVPDHGIFGEEFGQVRPDAAYQWVIDPIDGTRAFMAGYPLFTTLIALAHEGVPVLGIIDQPILHERWGATSAGACELKGARVSVRGTSLDKAVVATTSAAYFTAEQLGAYGRLAKVCGHTVSGGDAYAYAMLASGQLNLVVDAGMKPYDFCALAPVIAGAGGVITDWAGKALTLHSDGTVLAAATPELHAQALQVLSVGKFRPATA